LGEAGRRLFRLLGQLPAGIAAQDRDLLEEKPFEAASHLLATGLAFERAGRVDLLPPIRDHAKRFHLPEAADTEHWCLHYLSLVREHGVKIGRSGGQEAVERLTPELPNLDAAVQTALDGGKLADARAAIHGFSELMRFTGLGTVVTLRKIAAACRDASDTIG